MVKNRIAIHVLWDFCLPLQKGKPGTDERIKSCNEIKKVLEEHNYDYDDIFDAGYYIADAKDWEERNGNIWFKNSLGNIEIVKREWVIFEKDHPSFFKLLGGKINRRKPKDRVLK